MNIRNKQKPKKQTFFLLHKQIKYQDNIQVLNLRMINQQIN